MEANFLFSVFIFMMAFIISISLHELAHAFVADRLGDPTPRDHGRLTMNPLAHLTLAGTLLPLILLLTKTPLLFGWGKPVVINPHYFKNPKLYQGIVAAAGPTANIILCFVAVACYQMTESQNNETFDSIFQLLIYLNAYLAVFNLIPLHPLDGGQVLGIFLPKYLYEGYLNYIAPYSTFIFIALIISGHLNKLSWLAHAMVQAFFRWLS